MLAGGTFEVFTVVKSMEHSYQKHSRGVVVILWVWWIFLAAAALADVEASPFAFLPKTTTTTINPAIREKSSQSKMTTMTSSLINMESQSIVEGKLGNVTVALPLAGGGTAGTPPKKIRTPSGNYGSTKTSTSSSGRQIWPRFALYYLLNYGFFKYSTGALLQWWFPWTLGWLQMAAGIVLVGPLWMLGLRKVPLLDWKQWQAVASIAVASSLLHMASILCLGCGGVGSLVQNVRGFEPAVTTIVQFLLLGQQLSPAAMASLVVLTFGILMANTPDAWNMTLSTRALLAALGGTVASAYRVVLAKRMMLLITEAKSGTTSSSKQRILDAQNLYTVSTILSSCIMLPVMLSVEGLGLFRAIQTSMDATSGIPDSSIQLFARQILLSCFFYYAFNEVGFGILDQIQPVSFVVGTAIKRPVLVFWARLAHGWPLYHRGELYGGILAILSACVYAHLTMNERESERQQSLGPKETVVILVGLSLVAIVAGG